jgi:hypothetical protein
MNKPTDQQIESTYNLIKDLYNKHLKAFGVKLPALKNKCGDYHIGALVLVKLAENYPNTTAISKKDLTTFVRFYKPETNDVQQARHLAMQSGFNIISGTRGDSQIAKDEYKLVSLTTPYLAFRSSRRAGFSGDFEEVKKQYNYRCATCGSTEGESHLFRTGVIVQLQKGHMDPTLHLDQNNIIPQCSICNRADRNKWVYDKTGRVVEVAPTEDGLRIVNKFNERYNNLKNNNE